MLAFVCWLAGLSVLAHTFVQRTRFSQRQRALRGALGGALCIVAFVVGPSGLVLQKIIARLLMPAAWAWNLAWLGFIGSIAYARRRLAIASAVLGLLLTLAGSEAIGHALFHWLERDYQADPYAQGRFDAVFLLGGGVDDAPHKSFELGSSGDRVMVAARMHHRGLAPQIVISGTLIEGLAESVDSITATHAILRDLGVPESAIVRQSGHTRTTSEEATAAARMMKERSWTRVGVITSAWHMRRALALFRGAGLDPVPLAADHRGALRWEGLYSIIPRDAGYYLVSKGCWELLGGVRRY